jgi:hypothetical protein
MELEIAGRHVPDPADAVADYLRDNERLIREYDLGESDGGPHEITAHDVLRTRWSRIRIDGGDLQYFVDSGRSAPWHVVAEDAHLAGADPDEEGGLYDAAEELYHHFYNGRPRGVTPPKIHMVLHMKRPHLYPLLDGRVQDIYDEAAREVSRKVEGRRGRRGRLFWAAIREDLLRNADVITELRKELAGREEPAALGADLSDVRLHDIVCWSLVTSRG